MRKFIFLALAMCSTVGFGQKLITKTGSISFDGSVPSFEPVKAKNESVSCAFNSDNGSIASLALVKAFRFKTALMEEHFNENYIESNKFPKAILKGKLVDFNNNDLSDKPKEYLLKGSIELHGIKKNISIKANLTKRNDGVLIESDFTLNASDFEITIPAFVKSKLTDVIKVNVGFLVK